MLIIFNLLYYITYFFVLLLFMSIAIATAKRKSAWIWYAIGAVLQFLPLLGNQQIANRKGTNTTIDWVIYFTLLIIAAVLIIKRFDKANTSANADKEQ